MDKPIPFIEHLKELRKRLLFCICFFIAFLVFTLNFSNEFLGFLIVPLQSAMKEAGGTNRIIFTGLAEGFLTNLKIAIVFALIFTLPIILLQIWRFISPALTERETKPLRTLFIFPPFLFLCGASLAYFYVIPLAWDFFMSFQDLKGELPIELEPKLIDYINLSLSFLFTFGLAFQLPLILIILVFMNILSAKAMIKSRRYVILLMFIVSALLTPPDVFSLFCLAIPLIILYEISIILAKRMKKPS